MSVTYNAEELNSMNLNDIRKMATFIPGRWDMRKDVLIGKILAVKKQEPVIENVESPTSADRARYVKNIKEGDFVAFMDHFRNGKGILVKKMIAAKVVHVITPGEMFRVQTKRGSVYQLFKTQIEWVKTGVRWPKGIYDQMKGEPVPCNDN